MKESRLRAEEEDTDWSSSLFAHGIMIVEEGRGDKAARPLINR